MSYKKIFGSNLSVDKLCKQFLTQIRNNKILGVTGTRLFDTLVLFAKKKREIILKKKISKKHTKKQSCKIYEHGKSSLNVQRLAT